MFSASPSASGPPAHPRVGVATFVVDDRDYILIGKRKGSHGSGTLALPGGHLEWQESFEECAARELVEETGIEVGGTAESSVEFLTAVNTTHLKDPTDSGEGKHYVTIFMMARVRRRIGQDEVIARVSVVYAYRRRHFCSTFLTHRSWSRRNATDGHGSL